MRKEHQAELQRKADLLAAQKAELSAADIREKALEEAAASSREKAKRDSVCIWRGDVSLSMYLLVFLKCLA